LAHSQILAGQRGSSGGFSLVREPATLTVLEVISAVDPLERINVCPLGLAAHGERLCLLHRRVDDAVAMVERAFGETTIAELLRSPGDTAPLCPGLQMCEPPDSRPCIEVSLET
jgi:DNA-binding IscR family transcriptional regulator